MRMHAPLRLWSFLFADVLRLGGMAAGSLVVVVAFAFSLRFLAEGRIDLAGALRLTTLAMVPMLQYTLPFAGGFAATLSYHRFAADNEAIACASGGISHRSILFPAAATGLAVGLLIAFMSNQVIPRFLRAMEELVTRDVASLLERSIDRGESVRLGNIELHARGVVRAGADPAVGAFERLRLEGVLAATLNPEGRVQGFISAREVSVWLFSEESGGEAYTSAQFLFRDASGEGVADIVRSGEFASQRVRIPSSFAEDPKYLTWSELSGLREHPERLGKIESLRIALARRIAEARAVERVASEALPKDRRIEFARVGGERVVLRGAGLLSEGERWRVLPDAGVRVIVERRLRPNETRTLVAPRAWLERAADPTSDSSLAVFDLRLEEFRIQGDESPTPNREAFVLRGLTLDGSAELDAELLALPVRALLDRASESAGRLGTESGAPVRAAASALGHRLDDLLREVTSKQHERFAYAAASALTLLAGAIAGLRRRDALPLQVYLWSFFPALAGVITISAGQGLTHKAGEQGLLLLWGGVAALALLILIEYRRLRAH